MQSNLQSNFEKIGKKIKNSDGKGIFKNLIIFQKLVAKSTGLGFDTETIPRAKKIII